MTNMQRRIARARLLRREGKTYDEIRAVVGPVSDDRLQTWLAGIPRPPQTRLSRPLTELRRECRRLRLQGMSYSEIAAATGASAGSLSLWLRDLHGAPAVRAEAQRRALKGPNIAGSGRSAQASRRREEQQRAGADLLGPVSDRDLLVVGAALYWAEGSKAKPWRPTARQIVLTNSDVDVIRAFLVWLDLMQIPETERTYRLHIHESVETSSHERWWAEQLSIPLSSFMTPTLKRHKPTTVRRNTGELYHGCLVVRVKKSAGLYDRLEGMWRSLAHAAAVRSLGVQQSRVV